MVKKTGSHLSESDFPTKWLSVEAPSDRLTLGQLRRIPHGSFVENLDEVETLVHNVMLAEWEVGCCAARKPKNATEARVHEGLTKGYIRELADQYVEVGLASGRHEAEHLADTFYTSLRKQNRQSRERT